MLFVRVSCLPLEYDESKKKKKKTNHGKTNTKTTCIFLGSITCRVIRKLFQLLCLVIQ